MNTSAEIKLVEKEFEGFSTNSKVWIYQGSRMLLPKEKELIEQRLEKFSSEWASHGSKLKSKALVVKDLFLVFVVDETMHEASGCSIDKSVHLVKELEQLVSIDYFDRMKLAYLDNDGNVEVAKLLSIKALKVEGKINDNTLIFNNLITELKRLNDSWLVPIKDSWASKFLS